MRALVAMSGGVDSSVAAALMLEQGHDVVGVTLKQWQGADGSMPTRGRSFVTTALRISTFFLATSFAFPKGATRRRTVWDCVKVPS